MDDGDEDTVHQGTTADLSISTNTVFPNKNANDGANYTSDGANELTNEGKNAKRHSDTNGLSPTPKMQNSIHERAQATHDN